MFPTQSLWHTVFAHSVNGFALSTIAIAIIYLANIFINGPPDTPPPHFWVFAICAWGNAFALVGSAYSVLSGKPLGQVASGLERAGPRYQPSYYSLSLLALFSIFTVALIGIGAPAYFDALSSDGGVAHARRGEKYLYGKDGVTKDEAEAAKWFRKGAEEGNAYAQSALGIMLINAQGVPRDAAEALKWLRRAEEQGDARGQVGLGVIFANGDGVQKDEARAVELFRKAAKSGDAQGRTRLAYMLRYGKGVAKDEKEATKLYKMAAAQGYKGAQLALQELNERQIGREPKKREISEAGRISTNLCWSYQDGRGVASDPNEAVKWVRKNAEHGDVSCQTNLGYLYLSGQNVDKNYSEAYKWFRAAAEAGDAEAQLHLGMMYFYGKNVERNLPEATVWLKKSAAQGNPNASGILRDIVRN